MSAVLNNVVKKIGELKQELGHKIWLAGLGAYSRGVEEFNGISGKSTSLLDELLERGREVERLAKERVANAKERVSSTASQTSSVLEDRLHGIEQRLRTLVAKLTGLDAQSMTDLNERLKKLTMQVEELVATQKTEKPAAKKVVTAKPKAVRRRTPAKAKSAE